MSYTEVVIATGVFSILITMTLFLYERLMFSYKASSWKQEKNNQSELFWDIMRKSLEHATDLIQKNGTAPDFKLIVSPFPVSYRSFANGNSKILLWNVDHIDENGELDYRVEYSVSLSGRKLSILSEKKSGSENPSADIVFNSAKVLMTDVDSVAIKSTNIRASDDSTDPARFNEHYLELTTTSTGKIVGSIVEISIVLSPPESIGLENLKILQNNKFKVNVSATENPSL
ncbi:MAG: hypothetical protein HQM10_17310 [Candidatus Riflebacteria bacterium]|nr:hypothetical protein [Candidatus Riflebacteria bacterium]